MSDITETIVKVSPRVSFGKSSSKKLRKNGEIPAVFYGKSKISHLSLNDSHFRALLRKSSGSISLLELEDQTGKKDLALLKDLQMDTVKDKILHVDFLEVTRGEDLVAKVPLVIEGDALGVKNMGGILEVHANEIELKCRPSKLPPQVSIDVSNLNIGETLQLKDLLPIDGVEYLGDSNSNLVSCVGSASGRADAALDDSDEDSDEDTAVSSEEAPDQPSEEEGA